MPKLLTIFKADTGRVVFEGYAHHDPLMDQPGYDHLFTEVKPEDKVTPDPSQVWVVEGQRLARSEVDPGAMASGLAEEEAESQARAYYAAVDEAVKLAPRPVLAAKASQAAFTVLLRIINKLVQGEALTAEDQTTFQALADKFLNAASALPDSEALTEIEERLGEADQAMAKLDELTKGA